MAKKYSIGEVARICGMPIKTLRYYDEIGLAVPEFRNRESNYRYYSKKQMEDLFIIKELRQLGIGIKEIKCLFKELCVEELMKTVANRLNEIDEEVKSLESSRCVGQVLLGRLQKGGNPCSEEIMLEQISKGTLLFERGIMKNYQNAEISLERWIAITDKCRAFHLTPQSSVIVTYYEPPLEQFVMKDTDVEFAMLVDKDTTDRKDFRSYGGYEAISKIHVGKHADLVRSHISMLQWINQNNYELTGPVSEEYMISPIDISNEKEYMTKVIMPVKKR